MTGRVIPFPQSAGDYGNDPQEVPDDCSHTLSEMADALGCTVEELAARIEELRRGRA